MGSVDDALPRGSSHLSTATVPSLSLRLLVFLPSGSLTYCTPWSVFQDGSDEAIRLPAAMAHKWQPPARDPRHSEPCTQSTPHGSLAWGGPAIRRAPRLPRFLGRTGASYARAVSCPCGTGPHRLTFRCRLVAPV